MTLCQLDTLYRAGWSMLKNVVIVVCRVYLTGPANLSHAHGRRGGVTS